MNGDYIDMPEFIREYTTLNADFADDFYYFYDSARMDAFSIDVEELSEWMHISKNTMKKVLVRSYVEGVDYKIEKCERRCAGRPKEIIRMTPRCFSHYIMQSRSARGKEAREFMLNIEEFFIAHFHYVAEQLPPNAPDCNEMVID